MLIKPADDKRPQIDALTALLARPDVDAATRRRIETEIRTTRAGAAGERDAAYEIEFDHGPNRNRMTIHDLRLEVDGRVAQIDHLIITRLVDFWVCESKHFTEGVAINEHGEWTAFYGRQAHGISSPVEQNRKHVAVLRDLFEKDLVRLPRRLGITIKPRFKSVILVSNKARITRPGGKLAAQVDGLDSVMKAEQLFKAINDDFDQRSTAAIAKAVSADTIERIARDIAALHKPASFDWAPQVRLGHGGARRCHAGGRPTSRYVVGHDLCNLREVGHRSSRPIQPRPGCPVRGSDLVLRLSASGSCQVHVIRQRLGLASAVLTAILQEATSLPLWGSPCRRSRSRTRSSNSPFTEPTRHFKFDDDAITSEWVSTRGTASVTLWNLVKSKQRVADHGEVFTPAWLVEDMLDLVKGESERIDARFLEPACGSGNFLVPVLRRKLATVHAKFAKSDFEKRHHALLALMCIYGIELLPDNAAECRVNLLDTCSTTSAGRRRRVVRRGAGGGRGEHRPGRRPRMTTIDRRADHVPRVGLPRQGQVPAARLPLRHAHAASSIEGTLFANVEEHDVFIPTRPTRR